ncbi:hypothetical protein GCM10011412_39760 [Maribacter cobaltidurans]|nr:hypothetical protein GCM10011412_39760 [Maribacter cobaltidurans]
MPVAATVVAQVQGITGWIRAVVNVTAQGSRTTFAQGVQGP